MSTEFLITMLGMAVILYATRIGGLWIINRLPASSSLDVWLNQLPAVTLIALAAPAIAREGWIGAVAAIAIWTVMKVNGNIMLAMVLGVGIVALLRQIG
ncbi:MAG TPA: AzlD domain-containing protein [Thermomicrobiales bacterium]|nr:AzlD domain-containing protein [Thermomicrobiales bacterium]